MPQRHPIGFGFVDGQPVFLDLHSDSYFLLEQEEMTAFLLARSAFSAGGPEPGADGLAAAREAAPPGVGSSVLDLPEARTPPLLVPELWLELRRARRDLARKPLAGLMDPFVRLPRSGHATLRDECIELGRQVARARTLVPQPRHCLTDSLALMRVLARRKLSALLVFGAKLDPFAAHCWVQSGEAVLNDHVDTVRRFTPVLTIPA